jgi:hypothetical protein
MKFGSGYSKTLDSAQAAIESVEKALEESGEPSLTFLITTEFYDHNVVFKSVKNLVGDSKILGFCSGGIITPEGLFTRGIGACTLSGKKIRVKTSLQKNIEDNPRLAGEKAGKELLSAGIDTGTVFVFPDGAAANIPDLVQGLYNHMGPDFQYVGGGSAFNTYQVTEKGVEKGGLATALVEGIDIKTGIGHGWQPKTDPMIITRSNGKKIHEINGIPAFDAYCGQINDMSAEKFEFTRMKYSLGFPDISGNYLIREPFTLNPDKSMDLVTEIPQNAVGNVMESEISDLIENMGKILLEIGEIEKTDFVIIFDCIGRYLFMGDEFHKELEVITESIGQNVPLLGALTFGEVGSYIDVPLLHNKTTVILGCKFASEKR